MNERRLTVAEAAEDVQETASPYSAGIAAGLTQLFLQALADKSLQWVAMLGAIGFWGVAVAHPDVVRCAAAAGYSLCVYLPMLWRKR